MTRMAIVTIREGVFNMVEFVDKHGHRFPVVESDGNYFAVTESHGNLWITPFVHGNGYAISVDGIAIIGKLRVKAGGRSVPERKAIDIPLIDAEMRSEAFKALASRKAVLYFGAPHKVVAVMSGIPHSTATLMPVTVQTEWTSIPIYEPLPEAIPGYRIECRVLKGEELSGCMYRYVSLDEANA